MSEQPPATWPPKSLTPGWRNPLSSLLEEDFTEIATDENHLVSFDTFGIYWISASFAVKQLRNKLMFFYNTFIAISFCNKSLVYR